MAWSPAHDSSKIILLCDSEFRIIARPVTFEHALEAIQTHFPLLPDEVQFSASFENRWPLDGCAAFSPVTSDTWRYLSPHLSVLNVASDSTKCLTDTQTANAQAPSVSLEPQPRGNLYAPTYPASRASKHPTITIWTLSGYLVPLRVPKFETPVSKLYDVVADYEGIQKRCFRLICDDRELDFKSNQSLTSVGIEIGCCIRVRLAMESLILGI